MPATVAFDDLPSFLEACKEVDEWRLIEKADWKYEIGALVEAAAELIPEPPLLIFDSIKDYPPGYRVASLVLTTYRRTALALGLPLDRPRLELVRLAARKIQEASPISPKEVETAPVMSNAYEGSGIDLLKFPSLHVHEGDGGRYIGTGCVVINRDPDSGYVNLGTYRLQVHETNLLGLWQSPGQQGRLICERYWKEGKSCPVVATFGQDPLTFMAAHTKIPWGQSELEYVGGLRGRPLEVVPGPLTGLPIPAHAEIAIEGEIPPPDLESREEGPFGEWPGYFSGGTLGTGEPQPVVRVRGLYHRSNPILWDEAPTWTGAPRRQLRINTGVLWDQLEKAGVDGIVGLQMFNNFFIAVSIRQRYAGHARQVGHAVLGCAASARNGRYVVVVDDDIDPTDLREVLWAMETRVDPSQDIEIVEGCWSTPLDPRMSPEKRAARDHTSGRAVFYAVRPFPWRDRFPPVSRSSKELRRDVVRKYAQALPFFNLEARP
jgi:UbiD family decarboxylase